MFQTFARINFRGCRRLIKKSNFINFAVHGKPEISNKGNQNTCYKKIDTFLLVTNHKPSSNASNVFPSSSDSGSEQSSESPSGSHSESESSSFSLIFSRKQSSFSGKSVNKLRFSRNWRDSIRDHIYANGSKDGRPLKPSLIVPKMLAFFQPLPKNSFPHWWTCDYIIQRAVLRAMVWELKNNGQSLSRLAPPYFQALEIFVLKTMY